ncbi:MAG TPA: hypothetical protein VMS30_08155 [Phycisphaerales bacterium]|nr:hypothetical protein [Phycisphaerales bacterium]
MTMRGRLGTKSMFVATALAGAIATVAIAQETPPQPPAGGGQGGPGGGGRGPGGGDGGPQMVVMEGTNQKYRLDFYAQISNVFNYVNYGTFIGNQLSPFFGSATNAGPARRMELGFSLGF